MRTAERAANLDMTAEDVVPDLAAVVGKLAGVVDRRAAAAAVWVDLAIAESPGDAACNASVGHLGDGWTAAAAASSVVGWR